MCDNGNLLAVAAFIDTNLLVHGRSLEELPWKDIALGANDIEIQVGITVLRELDRHKADGNTRRARRAKKAGAMFGEIRSLPSRLKVLHEADPRVVLRVMPRVRIPWDEHPELDHAYADDALVAEALAQSTQDRQTIVISHDNGLLMTADQLGLATFEVPDSWLLKPEDDSQEKEVKALKAEIAALKAERNEPELTFDFVDHNGIPITNLEVLVPQFPPLTEAGLNAAMLELKRRYPKAHVKLGQPAKNDRDKSANRGSSVFDIADLGWYGPTAMDIAKYSQDYVDFLQQFRELLHGLPAALIEVGRFSRFGLLLANNEKAPAEGVELSIEAVGGLVRQRKLPEWTSPKKPSVPLPPDEAYAMKMLQGATHLHSGFGLSPFHSPPESPDQRKFYWDESWVRVYRKDGTLTCNDFRHGKTFETSLAVGFPKVETVSGRGAVKVSVAARNMPIPLTKLLSVSVKQVERDQVEMLRTAGCSEEIVELVQIARA
jgi:hypothetical protein